MKFLCLTMWLGGLYTDNDTDANTNTDTDSDTDNDGQSMIVWALRLINQMSQKWKQNPKGVIGYIGLDSIFMLFFVLLQSDQSWK